MNNVLKLYCDILRLVVSVETDQLEEMIRRRRIRKRKAVHEMFLKRKTEGAFRNLYDFPLSNDEELFRKFLRLPPKIFQNILRSIESQIILKPYNRNKEPISPTQQLCLTLRFLATGESHTSLGLQFRISKSYVGVIIRKVLQCIINKKLKEVLPEPTEEQWENIESKFSERWNFPMCVGVIDGKLIGTQWPNNSGYQAKVNYTSVLFALVDADLKFIAIDVISRESENDTDVFSKCHLGQQIQNNEFAVPPQTYIEDTDIIVPHVFLGDRTFDLKPNLMIPYSQDSITADTQNTKAIFNEYHARVTKLSENAFEILNNFWHILNAPISMKPDMVEKIVVVSCILHNMLMEENITTIIADDCEKSPNKHPCFVPLPPLEHERTQDRIGKQIRNNFRSYFASADEIIADPLE